MAIVTSHGPPILAAWVLTIMDARPGFEGVARMITVTASKWQLTDALTYRSALPDHPGVFTVPAGFRTSFRSVPRLIRGIVMPDEDGPRPATAPAVLFAWLVKQSGEGRDESQDLFREALSAARVPLWQRILLRVVG